MKDDRVALITGATGFVGSHLARRLVKKGWDVHIIIRPQSNLKIISDVIEKLTIHRHDETTDRMFDIFSETKPAIVFHLASLFLAQHQSKDIESIIKSNILFGTQLVEAMVTNGAYKMVNTGTSWQHYNNEVYNPVCLYAATKQAFEDILKFYVETSDLKVITLKLFDTYGPGDPRLKLFTLLRKAIEEQTELVMSPGEQLIDFVYIDDVIEGYIMAAKRLIDNKVLSKEEYAISSGNPISLKELVALYGQITGKPLRVKWGGRSYRPREVMTPRDKGQKLPGWQPTFGLIEGIKRMEKKYSKDG